jgi:hypothetical protein
MGQLAACCVARFQRHGVMFYTRNESIDRPYFNVAFGRERLRHVQRIKVFLERYVLLVEELSVREKMKRVGDHDLPLYPVL